MMLDQVITECWDYEFFKMSLANQLSIVTLLLTL